MKAPRLIDAVSLLENPPKGTASDARRELRVPEEQRPTRRLYAAPLSDEAIARIRAKVRAMKQ